MNTLFKSHIFATLALGFYLIIAGGPTALADAKKGKEIRADVKIACGKCIFKMKDVDECALAVKINGKSYLVTGATIDLASAGLCKQAKDAQVVGRIIQYPGGIRIGGQDGEFIAESIKLKESERVDGGVSSSAK